MYDATWDNIEPPYFPLRLSIPYFSACFDPSHNQHGPRCGMCFGIGPFLSTFAQNRSGNVGDKPCEARYSSVISTIIVSSTRYGLLALPRFLLTILLQGPRSTQLESAKFLIVSHSGSRLRPVCRVAPGNLHQQYPEPCRFGEHRHGAVDQRSQRPG